MKPVGGDLESIGAAEARNILAWWLEAGVDAPAQESPRNWLKPASPPERPQAQPLAEPNVAQPDAETLAELRAWLESSAHVPLAAPSARRILPHGPENAAVMLLSDAPALEDATAGQPIGGDAWLLATRMLAAIKIPADEAYSASLSCFHSPGTRMSEQERQSCGELARQHIRVARPKRLLLLGDGPCLTLLGKRLIDARGHVHKVEGVRTVATFHPRYLINHPLAKREAWRDLLLLMEDGS